MSGVATAIVGGSIIGGVVASKGAKSAAKTSAKATENAAELSAEAAAQARADAIELFDPALKEFIAGIQRSIDSLNKGTVSSQDILRQTYRGADQMLLQGMYAAQKALQSGYTQSRADTNVAKTQSRTDINTGYTNATNALYSTKGEALNYGERSISEIGDAEQKALAVLGKAGPEGSTIGGISYESPLSASISSIGNSALQKEAALSGALGQEAQAAAYAEFQESAGQKWLREREEQSLLRNQAAIGGLGGGTVRTALQEQAVGIASTQQQQQVENLRAISTLMSQLQMQKDQLAVQTIAGAANQTAAVRTNQMQSSLSTGSQLAQAAQSQGQNLATIEGNAGNQLATLASGYGIGTANLLNQLQQQRAQTYGQYGTQQATLASQNAVNIANQQTLGAQGQANLRMQQGSLLGNIATQNATNQGNAIIAGGQAQAAGILGSANAWNQAIGNIGTGLGYVLGQPQQPMQPTTGQWGIIG